MPHFIIGTFKIVLHKWNPIWLHQEQRKEDWSKKEETQAKTMAGFHLAARREMLINCPLTHLSISFSSNKKTPVQLSPSILNPPLQKGQPTIVSLVTVSQKTCTFEFIGEREIQLSPPSNTRVGRAREKCQLQHLCRGMIRVRLSENLEN